MYDLDPLDTHPRTSAPRRVTFPVSDRTVACLIVVAGILSLVVIAGVHRLVLYLRCTSSCVDYFAFGARPWTLAVTVAAGAIVFVCAVAPFIALWFAVDHRPDAETPGAESRAPRLAPVRGTLAIAVLAVAAVLVFPAGPQVVDRLNIAGLPVLGQIASLLSSLHASGFPAAQIEATVLAIAAVGILAASVALLGRTGRTSEKKVIAATWAVMTVVAVALLAAPAVASWPPPESPFSPTQCGNCGPHFFLYLYHAIYFAERALGLIAPPASIVMLLLAGLRSVRASR
jgi:hypothetical protein